MSFPLWQKTRDSLNALTTFNFSFLVDYSDNVVDITVHHRSGRNRNYWRSLFAIIKNLTNNNNYVDQQTLKTDDDYVLLHQRLWTFDAPGWLPSATERSPLSPSSEVVLNRISILTFLSRFPTLLLFVHCSRSQSLVILDTIIVIALL